MGRIKLGLVGVGKIARDQHLPVLAASEDFELIATASRNAQVEGVRGYASLAAMLDAHPEIEAISLCTPPSARAPDARLALEHGRHVMLEKPPAATLSELAMLERCAAAAGATLYASWHSRHAPGVAPARAWLADKLVRSVAITWKEDIRVWHPGQEWILGAGGLGIFDPGVNALSIATYVLPLPFALTSATLEIPENRQGPIAARMSFRDEAGAAVEAELDFRERGPQIWDIRIETDGGALALSCGGAQLTIDDMLQSPARHGRHCEYEGVYARFAQLIRGGETDVDPAPLRHVADAFMAGERRLVEPFLF